MGIFKSIGKAIKKVGSTLGKVFKTVGGPLISGGFDLLGGFLNRSHQEEMADAQYDAQREFAQHGIRWRVEDAKAAGLHPLAALGYAGQGYAPQRIFADPVANAMGRMGQDLGRAISTMKTKEEKEIVRIRIDQEREKLKNMKLRNSGLEKLQRENETNNPSMPRIGRSETEQSFGIVGQDDAATKRNLGVEYVAPRLPTSKGIGVSSGTGPLQVSKIRKDGYLYFLPIQEAQEALESTFDFWLQYHAGSLSELWNGLKASWKGTNSEFTRRWYKAFKPFLPETGPERVWVYRPLRGQWQTIPVDQYYKENFKRRKRKREKERMKKVWNELTF